MITDPFAAEATDPVVPNRFRTPLLHVVDDVMPEDWLAEFGQWLHAHRDRFARGGDDAGENRHNWELFQLDKYCPELAAPLRARVVELYPAALPACSVPEFELQAVDQTATLHHHGSHFTWHDDGLSPELQFVATRRLAYALYLHTEPRRFSGGELEFLDGTAVEPKLNRLALFHPLQKHRVRKVECWSAAAIDGRWAVIGWLHGPPPPGWVERAAGLISGSSAGY
jgi:hypothetical protein